MATPVLDAIERSRPIIGGLLKAALQPAIEEARAKGGKTVSEVVDTVAPVIAARIEADPVLRNNLNQETPAQSRTTLGAIGIIMVSLGSIWAMLKSGTFDQMVFSAQITAIVGAVYVLYGRWWPNLKPLFSRK